MIWLVAVIIGVGFFRVLSADNLYEINRGWAFLAVGLVLFLGHMIRREDS